MAIKELLVRFVNRIRGRSAMEDEVKAAVVEGGDEAARQKEIVRAQRYYRGEQRVPLTDRQEEFLGFDKSGDFRVNYCKTVVNAVAERMILAGFTAGGDDEDKQPLTAWAEEVWSENRGDALQMRVHKAAIRDGEYFVLVSPNANNPRIPMLVPHPRYVDPANGGSGFGIRAHYNDDDPTQPMLYASKRWTETVEEEGADGRIRRRRRQRLTLYYPDRVERYMQAGNTWGPFVEEEGSQWPIPWVARSGEPLGIPVVHFQNPDLTSELEDAIPIQDAINKAMLDVLAAADAAGFPIRFSNYWVTTDGKPPASDGSNYLEISPGCFITIPEPDAKLENLSASDLSQLVSVYGELIITLARVTDTPLSRFLQTRQVAAEGTLKQQEEPLLSKVRSRQVVFGNAWEDCMAIARRLSETFSDIALPEGHLEAVWLPAETRDEPSIEEKLKAGIPQEQIWSEMGYTQEQIEAMKAMDEIQARQAQRRLALDAAGMEEGG